MSRYGYLLAFFIPAFVVAGFYLGGWWNMLSVAFIFIIEPLIDTAGGINLKNLNENQASIAANDRFYKRLLYLWVLVQFLLLGWACYIITMRHLIFNYEIIGFALGMGLVTGGIGITVAHELGHKKSKTDRFLSKLLLMSVGYMHFYIEHNQGHHRHVATPQDPSTARKNQSFYRFWFRTVIGSYFSAWRIENKRLRNNGRSVLSIYNQMIWFQILPFLFLAVFAISLKIYNGYWSWEAPVFLMIQGIIAFTLLELVNYVEHYGILRKEIAPGKYERVNPIHSWNSNHRVSNYFLFHLQRHSDHHYYASKPYQVLNHHDESPQLPAGYPTMIITALLPPVWFSIMNKRLESWEKAIPPLS